ncbi:metal ABC transporter substrate-binding protein, partial [Pectobacterium brasiliense]|nr:metal ABC transporter substrate-binding protein [Pectobacterium brasiliense]
MTLTHSVRAVLGITLLAAGMQLALASSDPQTITFGVAPGPYGDM